MHQQFVRFDNQKTEDCCDWRIGMQDDSNAKLKSESILVVDDHLLLVDTLKAVMVESNNFRIDTSQDVESAINMVDTVGRYDLILLDYDVPGMDSLRGMHRLIAANGGGVALFSGVVGFATIERAVKEGAAGFVPKTLSLEALSHAIRMMIAGETYLPADWYQWRAKYSANEFRLKPREMRVLELLCTGLQNKEIAYELGVSEVIVKLDVRSVCQKLDVRNRTEAVLFAHQSGLCELK